MVHWLPHNSIQIMFRFPLLLWGGAWRQWGEKSPVQVGPALFEYGKKFEVLWNSHSYISHVIICLLNSKFAKFERFLLGKYFFFGFGGRHRHQHQVVGQLNTTMLSMMHQQVLWTQREDINLHLLKLWDLSFCGHNLYKGLAINWRDKNTVHVELYATSWSHSVRLQMMSRPFTNSVDNLARVGIHVLHFGRQLVAPRMPV